LLASNILCLFISTEVTGGTELLHTPGGTPSVFLIFDVFFERTLYKSNYIIFILS